MFKTFIRMVGDVSVLTCMGPLTLEEGLRTLLDAVQGERDRGNQSILICLKDVTALDAVSAKEIARETVIGATVGKGTKVCGAKPYMALLFEKEKVELFPDEGTALESFRI